MWFSLTIASFALYAIIARCANISNEASMSTLRERRRIDTKNKIRRAAIELAYDSGLDNITAEMISEKAGVGRRTFFNYFPYKEAALRPAKVTFPDVDMEKFVAGRGALMSDLAILLEPSFAGVDRDRDIIQKSFEISCAAPKVQVLVNSFFQDLEEQLATAFARRNAVSEPSLDMIHLGALVGATLRVAVGAGIRGDVRSIFDLVIERLMAIEDIVQRTDGRDDR